MAAYEVRYEEGRSLKHSQKAISCFLVSPIKFLLGIVMGTIIIQPCSPQ